ncbi:hypothetical protein LCGC14_0564940 [marine sediment metagenome]|uniref:Uncharacterized protein n=1 Tax=marine sediment metagenome TaxID=412755 RepID=A0A0F9U7A8_9ZZZZ
MSRNESKLGLGCSDTRVSQETAEDLQASLTEFNMALGILDGAPEDPANQAGLMESAVNLFSRVVGLIGRRVAARAGDSPNAPEQAVSPVRDKLLTRRIAAVAKQDAEHRNFSELASLFFN